MKQNLHNNNNYKAKKKRETAESEVDFTALFTPKKMDYKVVGYFYIWIFTLSADKTFRYDTRQKSVKS